MFDTRRAKDVEAWKQKASVSSQVPSSQMSRASSVSNFDTPQKRKSSDEFDFPSTSQPQQPLTNFQRETEERQSIMLSLCKKIMTLKKKKTRHECEGELFAIVRKYQGNEVDDDE